MKTINVFTLFFVIVAGCLFAQAQMPDLMYQRVDNLAVPGKTTDLQKLLSDNKKNVWYGDLETYVLKKARQLVVQNDLDTAKQVCLSVIDTNLDSQEAFNLYQSVNAAIVKRDSEQKKKSESEALVEYKERAVVSTTKQEPSKTYKAIANTSSGKKVYLDQAYNTHYSSKTWDFMAGIVNVKMSVIDKDMFFRYGFALNGSFFNHGENFTVGADIKASVSLLDITKPETGPLGVSFSGSACMSVASNAFNKYLALRMGVFALGENFGIENVDPTLFVSPALGLGFRDVPLGKLAFFELGSDWYAGHLYTEGLVVAFGVHTGLTFLFAQLPDFGIYMRVAGRDSFRLYDTGLKNDTQITLAFGVGNYE